MTQPTPIIEILSRRTALTELDCDACDGSGVQQIPDPDTGHDTVDCVECRGSGYNTLGLLLHRLLNPPPSGWEAEALQAALLQAQPACLIAEPFANQPENPFENQPNEPGKAHPDSGSNAYGVTHYDHNDLSQPKRQARSLSRLKRARQHLVSKNSGRSTPH